MLFGIEMLLPNLHMNSLQALPRGLFTLTAEFQELVTIIYMTDRTSAGVLI